MAFTDPECCAFQLDYEVECIPVKGARHILLCHGNALINFRNCFCVDENCLNNSESGCIDSDGTKFEYTIPKGMRKEKFWGGAPLFRVLELEVYQIS